jgi:cyanate permease
MFGASAIAIGVGPYLMGRTFDATGTYNPAFAAFEVAIAITLVCVASLRPYVFPAKSEA